MLRAKCSLVINYDLIIAMKAYNGLKCEKGIKGGIIHLPKGGGCDPGTKIVIFSSPDNHII